MRDKDGGRFKVIRQLGAGAFGRTLLVTDSSRNDEQVVIKVPHDKLTEEALINELMQANALSANLVGMAHPNIVRCFGFGKFQDFFVMILEYVPGRDLRDIIGPVDLVRRPLDPKRAVEYVTKVCSGLAVAHRINLLHRDIKPDNIRVREDDDTPKILDFGISKIMESSYRRSGTVAGTIPYMSPESLAGRACMASDTWALAVTLYELVTGRMPFWDDNVFTLKQQIDTQTPVPPRKLNPAVDERLNALILRGLDKNPTKRFESAQEMLDALSGESLDREIARLRESFQAGKEEEAEKQARVQLMRFSGEPRLFMLIGEFANRRQQYAQAEAIVRQGIEAFPEHAGLYFHLAPALWNQGTSKSPEAITAMERAIKLGLNPAQERQARNLLRTWKATGGRMP
ncbi:MAG: protein kinase [Terracidiphilus sp.]